MTLKVEYRSISPYSVRMRENTDQNNFKYRHSLRSASFYLFMFEIYRFLKKTLYFFNFLFSVFFYITFLCKVSKRQISVSLTILKILMKS